MEAFWLLFLVLFFATKSLEKAESVKVKLEELKELPLQTFDELFVDEWWDKEEAEDLKMPAPTNFGQNVHHQIDRQNTQIGQIEPNSTYQNPSLIKSDHSGQIEPNSTYQNPSLIKSDHSGQSEPNSNDQNASLTESDHFENAKNDKEQNEMSSTENIAKDERKRKIIDKFHAMKDDFKQKGKYSKKEWNQIEKKISKHLKTNRKKIYEWKKEFGLVRKNSHNDRKDLVEKFDQMKAELKRDGFKNSQNELDKTVAKELGLSFTTIYKWKSEFSQTAPHQKHSDSEQKELLKRYYKIKGQNPKISDEKIAKMFKIARATLYNWKRQLKEQQLHPNSVEGHSVEENAAANVQKTVNSILGSN